MAKLTNCGETACKPAAMMNWHYLRAHLACMQSNVSHWSFCNPAGFDVWMANTRGNTFSRGNYNYTYRDMLYWRHSIDQYALVDAPAQIDTALQVSGAKKLAIVGHSQVRTRAFF
jgi:predicted alpha/beta hydrolase